MPQLSTGFVIAGAYADKLRRVLFAQLRDRIKKGEIDNKTVAMRAGELNRLLFDVIVNKLKLDKGDVVRIRVEYDIVDGDIKWRLDTLRIEAFRRIPDDEIAKAVKETVEKAEEVLAREVTAEERAWTEAREKQVEREVQQRAEEARAQAARAAELVPASKFDIASATIYGETRSGESLAVLQSSKGENIGLAILEPINGSTRLTVILIPGKGEAYRASTIIEKDVASLRENTSEIIEKIKSLKLLRIDSEEAENLIKRKLEELA